jgi:hypothetical protein
VLQLHALRLCFHSLPCTTQLSNEFIAPAMLVITSRHRPHRKHCSSIDAFVFVDAGTCLPSCCPETALVYSAILRSLHSNGCTRYIVPSLRLFVTNGLEDSKGCACDICDRSHLPPHGSVKTVLTLQLFPMLPPLRPFVTSGSLIRWEPVQVCHPFLLQSGAGKSSENGKCFYIHCS